MTASPQPAPQSRPPAPPAPRPTPPVQQQTTTATPMVLNPASVQLATRHISCGSDISGTRNATPVTGRTCLDRSQWTTSKPFNHSNSPLVFKPYQRPAVTIRQGQSLWSVVDASAPRGRRLEARPWDGTTTFQTLRNPTQCVVDYANAALKDFIVSIECELHRQARVQTDFEQREDGYMDPARCTGSSRIEPNQNWQSRSAQYWIDNPTVPTGWCVGPMVNNRRDRKPIREANWLPESECVRQREILNTRYTVTVNRRGVRGCKTQ